MSLHCFIQTQAPIPGSGAQPVHYPTCEWAGDDGLVDHLHPLNRFVCSWLTSDLNTLERCQEVLDAIAQIQAGQRTQWFADGDAFCVDFSVDSVQFNQSNVEPEDTTWWNLPEAKFRPDSVLGLLESWLVFMSSIWIE
jgi:hypothetical protein